MKNRITSALAVTITALGLAGLPAIASADNNRHRDGVFNSFPQQGEHQQRRHDRDGYHDRHDNRHDHRSDRHHRGHAERHHHDARVCYNRHHNHGHHYGNHHDHGPQHGYYRAPHVGLSGFYIDPLLGIKVVIR